MPRRSSEVPEPWVNIKVFSSEERNEIIAAGAMVIPVSYRHTHVADCIVDREIGMMISSIQRGNRNDSSKVPPVLFGAAGRARPPRILVNLVVDIEQQRIGLGDKTQTVFITEQKQWLLPRLVILLYTTPEEVLAGWFDGSSKEPKLPRDPQKSLLLEEAMMNVPQTKFLNGNVHDCRVVNIDCSVSVGSRAAQAGRNSARNLRSMERRQARQRQLESLGLVKSKPVNMMSPEEFAALSEDDKLRLLSELAGKAEAFGDQSFHAAPDLPAMQPIPQRTVKNLGAGGVEVLSQEDDQTIDAARVFGELERQKEAEASKGHEQAQIEGQSTSSTRPTDNYQALVNKITDPKTPPST